MRPGLALILGAVVVAATVVLMGRLALALRALGAAIDEIAAEWPPAATPRPLAAAASRALGEIRLTIERLARGWREDAKDLETRLGLAEAIIARAPDPLILLDGRRQILRANHAAVELVGTVSPPCDLASVLRNPALLQAADAVLRGEVVRIAEFTLAVPVERHLRARFAGIAGSLPTDPAVIMSLHDITELKRSDEMRADFVANASHELRTPLAALSGFIETLRGPAREDAEARARFLAIMDGQATRMTRLVEDLLSLSRIELNEHVAPQGRVALAPLLGHLAETLELRAAEREMRIVLAIPAGLPDVQGDRDELAQLFLNLFDNAIKYGRPGTEIGVAAELTQRRAATGAGAPERFVAVAVRDRGEGIAREHLPRLTERFYRVDTARSRQMGGTGLGLAIVKHILNRHRGILEIDSKVGEGSIFTVFLRPCGAPPRDTG